MTPLKKINFLNIDRKIHKTFNFASESRHRHVNVGWGHGGGTSRSPENIQILTDQKLGTGGRQGAIAALNNLSEVELKSLNRVPVIA